MRRGQINPSADSLRQEPRKCFNSRRADRETLLPLNVATGKKRRHGFGSAGNSTESSKQLGTDVVSIPTSVKIDDEQRFHIKVDIAGEKIVGLLNSEAQVSVAGKRFQEMVDSGLRTKPSKYAFRTADGAID